MIIFLRLLLRRCFVGSEDVEELFGTDEDEIDERRIMEESSLESMVSVMEVRLYVNQQVFYG